MQFFGDLICSMKIYTNVHYVGALHGLLLISYLALSINQFELLSLLILLLYNALTKTY